jgi:hypothetical protein
MDQLDALFKALALDRFEEATMIVCLYTGATSPAASRPMPRDPPAAVGMALDEAFGEAVREAVATNRAVHDGAIMAGREGPAEAYRVAGWSHRLFAPGRAATSDGANHGSAFHSCLAMSYEDDVDATYLVSAGRAYRFVRGQVVALT